MIPDHRMFCFRLLEENDPAPALADAVGTLREGGEVDRVFHKRDFRVYLQNI